MLPKDRQCEGKRKYVDPKKVKRFIKRMQAVKGGHWDSYVCPHCGYIHVGHRIPDEVVEAIKEHRRQRGRRGRIGT